MLERPHPSDLLEIAKRNGDFRRNYGILIGAFLYLRSIRAASGRSFCLFGAICALLASTLPWLSKLGGPSP